MTYSSYLNEITLLKDSLSLIEQTLSNSPSGTLQIRRHSGRLNLYVSAGSRKDGNFKETYLPVSSPQVRLLLNARYCRELKPLLEKELKCLQQFLERYHPEEKFAVIDRYPSELMPLISPVLPGSSLASERWAEESFVSNDFPFAEDAVYITSLGERVRSKAECIIADILAALGIAYRYECEYTFEGKRYFPDFTIRHPKTGELYYLEYFGMMGSEEYSIKALRKIAAYQQTPDAERFIFIFESEAAPMNTQAIRNLFKQYFCK